ncbi:MAG: four helix bundle suffix domain-containing protein [Patescibacteria group bacterium]|jgi:restriction system protein
MTESKIFPSHGGYRNLKSYQTSEIIYDATIDFCRKYINPRSRTTDQMIQAARSGKQNIAEGSQVSATSKKSEIKLISVARGSLEELLQDFLDYLRQNNLPLWGKDNPQVLKIRQLAYQKNRSYQSYKTYIKNPESAANCLICLIHQANFLLDRQMQSLEKDFLKNGGFTERLYRERVRVRKNNY